jgi:putative tricarboxylic transport membrane protein
MSAPARSGRGELGLVALLGAVGVGLLADARRITVPGSGNVIGPRFFPYVVGAVLVVVAVCLAVAVWRGYRAEPESGEDVDTGTGTSWWAVALIAGAFAGHALLIHVVGWPLAVSLMFGTVAAVLGARSWIRATLIGGVLAVLAWLLFVRVLGVSVPGGVLLEAVTGG